MHTIYKPHKKLFAATIKNVILNISLALFVVINDCVYRIEELSKRKIKLRLKIFNEAINVGSLLRTFVVRIFGNLKKEYKMLKMKSEFAYWWIRWDIG